MLRFFRQIRQRLLTDNKFSKYLLYAVGEILLVVIGILIALQIDNWNEWRKDREREQKVLETLADNLARNRVSLLKGLDGVESLHQSSQIIFDFFEGKITYHDSLDIHFMLGMRPGVMSGLISSEGYENYKNVGFDIILSDSLKANVLNLFEMSYPNLEAWRRLIPEINHQRENTTIRNQYLRRNKPIDIVGLLNSNDMYEMYAEVYDMRTLLELELKKALEETERVLNIITNHLAKSHTTFLKQ